MRNDLLPIWTLNDHLAAGSVAVSKICFDEAHARPERICHHFSEENPVDPMTASVEAAYLHLCPQFSALGLQFLPDRLEAWETAKPNLAWLQSRIPAVLDSVNGSGLYYQGWTW